MSRHQWTEEELALQYPAAIHAAAEAAFAVFASKRDFWKLPAPVSQRWLQAQYNASMTLAEQIGTGLLKRLLK